MIFVFLSKRTIYQLSSLSYFSSERPPDPNDKLVVHKFTLGKEKDDDPTSKWFYGHDAMNMIDLVRIEYYESDGMKLVKWYV